MRNVETLNVSRGLPVVGNLFEMRRDIVAFMTRVAREHGDVAWARQGIFKLLIVSGPEAAHQVFVDQAESFRKSYALSVFARPMLGDGLLTSEQEAHRVDRKRLAPAFAHKRVAAYADVMVARAEAAAARIIERGTIDFSEEMMLMTLEIVGKALFDADVGSDAEAIGEALTKAMQHMIDTLLSVLPIPPVVPTPKNLRAKRHVAELDAIVYRIIEDRRKAGAEDRGDVLSILLAPDEDGRVMSDREIRDHVMTLLLAGHETTANALAWTFAELAVHPEARARVENEVDTVLKGRAPTFDDLKQLPICLATFKEAMRLHPPAYTVGRLARAPATIGGQSVAKNRIVLVNVVGMHRRADLFRHPDTFEPERFLPEREREIPKRAFLPFGDGARVCIGNQFALMEGQLALATLAQRVRLSLNGAFPEPEPMITLRPRGGMSMRAQARAAERS